MQHAPLVREMNCLGNGPEQLRRLTCWQGTLAHEFRQISTVNQLHRKIGLSLMLADLMNRNDVRMAQARGRLCFAIKTLEKRRVSKRTREQRLYGHRSIETQLSRAINHAHAASGDFTQQLVVAQAGKRTG